LANLGLSSLPVATARNFQVSCSLVLA
ncbi:hypothetical protein A2U01_0108234, partial [Trifolium medium]|nr:hypothetical protein [Trifolium medium]